MEIVKHCSLFFIQWHTPCIIYIYILFGVPSSIRPHFERALTFSLRARFFMWNVKISLNNGQKIIGWIKKKKKAFYSSVDLFSLFLFHPVRIAGSIKEGIYLKHIEKPNKRKRGKWLIVYGFCHWMQCIKWIFDCTCLLWTKLSTTIDCDNTLSRSWLKSIVGWHSMWKYFCGTFLLFLFRACLRTVLTE